MLSLQGSGRAPCQTSFRPVKTNDEREQQNQQSLSVGYDTDFIVNAEYAGLSQLGDK